MRALVTGGAGFIGSRTVEALVSGGHDVLIYDSFVTGRSAYLRSVAVEVVRGNICHPLALQRTVHRFRPHAIIHLAACVSVPLSRRRALRSPDDHTRATLAG